MDTSNHDLSALFLQLGLPHQPSDIDRFIQNHNPLESNIPIDQAPFWTPGQAAFLREAISEDSDWCVSVDELNQYLRG